MRLSILAPCVFSLALASATAIASPTTDTKPAPKPVPTAAPAQKPSWTPSATGRENARRALKGPPGWQEEMEAFRRQPKKCFSPTGHCPDKKADQAEGAGAKSLVQPANASGKGG